MVKVIKEFLDAWYKKCEKFYNEAYDRYLVAYKEYSREHDELSALRYSYDDESKRRKTELLEQACGKKTEQGWETNYSARWKYVQDDDNAFVIAVLDRMSHLFHDKWAYVEKILERKDRVWADNLAYVLDKEYERKADTLERKVRERIGEITDASGLEINPKGDLNGYITGERGRVHLWTVGAGGHNIQCFHYRVLIKDANN